jgi:hypothetical protein
MRTINLPSFSWNFPFRASWETVRHEFPDLLILSIPKTSFHSQSNNSRFYLSYYRFCSFPINFDQTQSDSVFSSMTSSLIKQFNDKWPLWLFSMFSMFFSSPISDFYSIYGSSINKDIKEQLRVGLRTFPSIFSGESDYFKTTIELDTTKFRSSILFERCHLSFGG